MKKIVRKIAFYTVWAVAMLALFLAIIPLHRYVIDYFFIALPMASLLNYLDTTQYAGLTSFGDIIYKYSFPAIMLLSMYLWGKHFVWNVARRSLALK